MLFLSSPFISFLCPHPLFSYQWLAWKSAQDNAQENLYNGTIERMRTYMIGLGDAWIELLADGKSLCLTTFNIIKQMRVRMHANIWYSSWNLMHDVK
jgi:hypothetical protein